MRSILIRRASSLRGEVALLGDKSIAHRSIIISAISPGKTTIENFPTNKDCLYTLEAVKKLGVRIMPGYLKTGKKPTAITVVGKGLHGLKKPKSPIFVGDSGTTLRLLLGILAGQNFKVKLIAGKSLSYRPMLRVNRPLRMMGAIIKSQIPNPKSQIPEEYPPITIRGGHLKPITYKMPVASAQVKSAILLAGLYTKGLTTKVIEPVETRDHTERLLKLFKADIQLKQNTIVIRGNKEFVSPKSIYIPGDISSASFFLVLASILPKAQILIRKVSLNPSRIGIIKVLKRMGARIKVTSCKSQAVSYEPMGDIIVKNSKLKGTIIREEEIPSLIDELPILMVAASLASGKSIFRGPEELRVKETDRIRSMSENLKKMGADIQLVKAAKSEKIVIQGVKELKGRRVSSYQDHRTAMSMVVAALAAKGETRIDDIVCINKSFPEFLSILKTLIP